MTTFRVKQKGTGTNLLMLRYLEVPIPVASGKGGYTLSHGQRRLCGGDLGGGEG